MNVWKWLYGLTSTVQFELLILFDIVHLVISLNVAALRKWIMTGDSERLYRDRKILSFEYDNVKDTWGSFKEQSEGRLVQIGDMQVTVKGWPMLVSLSKWWRPFTQCLVIFIQINKNNLSFRLEFQDLKKDFETASAAHFYKINVNVNEDTSFIKKTTVYNFSRFSLSRTILQKTDSRSCMAVRERELEQGLNQVFVCLFLITALSKV